MLKIIWPRDGEVTSSWRVVPSWFLYKCDERYTLCLNLVSVVTPEMELKPIVLPDNFLHLWQKSYPFSILIMMASLSFYMKDKLQQDVILGSNFTKNELSERFYQDSEIREEGLIKRNWNKVNWVYLFQKFKSYLLCSRYYFSWIIFISFLFI